MIAFCLVRFLGLTQSNIQGIGGSILPMSSHGLVSSALFLCVGVLYDRHSTRLVRYYGGSVSTMPNLSTIFFSSTLANMSSPGTSSFIGEFLILVGAFQTNSLLAAFSALGMLLGAAYSLWVYNRSVSGNIKPDFLHKFSDPNGREVSIFIPCIVGGATVVNYQIKKGKPMCGQSVYFTGAGRHATFRSVSISNGEALLWFSKALAG